MTRRPARTPSTPLATPRRAPVSPSTAPRATVRATVRVVAALVALLGLVGTSAGLATSAAAHDALTGSTPADGTTVAAPPASVDLTFTQPPLGIGAEVQVTGPDGVVVNGGDLTITDTTVSQPLADGLPAGTYAVAWRVTSSDGHPISGELTFTAEAGTDPEPAATEPATDPTADPGTEPTAEPDPAETTPDEPASTPPADAADPGATDPGTTDGDGGTGPLPWVLGAVALLAVAGAAWWAARRRAGAGPTA